MDQSLLEAELSQLAKHCSIQQGTVYSPSRYAYLNQNRELFKCWKGVKWGVIFFAFLRMRLKQELI